jgi:hypothetical protein
VKVINIAEEIQGYQQKWKNHLERIDCPSTTGIQLPTEEMTKIMMERARSSWD